MGKGMSPPNSSAPTVDPPGRRLPVTQTPADKRNTEWWVGPAKVVALLVFIAIPVFAYFVQALAGRVVWTMLVAALPLFIVLAGYHRWRRICPLAFFAQVPARLRKPGKRKASGWLEANYYFVVCAVFICCLWIRLIATNGDGKAITVFFIALSLAALICGAIYTGKSWCNHFCPVSFVEKIYTEPHGLRRTENSQCEKCSACKQFCPDINQENGYWKEIGLRSKRVVYFAFPGLVFGFYFYYYLQAGTWDYYFGGSWTNEPGLIRHAFLPGSDAASAGLFFLPAVPRAVAAMLTLALCAVASFAVFGLLERLVGNWLRRRRAESDEKHVRHVMFSLAGFTAFVVFYSFAGQPSLRKLTFLPAPQLVSLVVVTTATLFLVRRLRRTSTAFAEETLARSIIKHWKWTDIRPPDDLREAFLVHNIKSRESDREAVKALEVYSDAVREVIANGFVAREEVKLLEHLRGRLQIKKSDHEKVMALLAKEERALLSNASGHSNVEKRLQLETYARALRNFIERVIAAQGDPDDTFIVRLRSEYAVTEAEHMAVLDELLGGASALAGKLGEELRTIERSALTIKALAQSPSATHDLLADLLRRRRAEAVESLLRALNFTADERGVETLRNALCSSDEALRQTGVRQLRASLPPAVAERLMSDYGEVGGVETPLPPLTEVLEARLRSIDPYVRAVALLALSERGAAAAPMLEAMKDDEHELVRDTAGHLLKSTDPEGGRARAGLCTVEKMVALRAVPLFAHLRPEDLAGLARASHEAEYRPGADLCVEGESGTEVFILIAGDVEVFARAADGERLVGREQAGGFIGELAVLDPAPRSARVRAGEAGAHVLRLDGEAFRHAVDEESSIATHVIRVLARRLRGASKT